MSRDLPPERSDPGKGPGARDADGAGVSETGMTGMTGMTGQTDQDGRDDHSGLPPFVSTWGGFYRLVLFTFLAMVLLFYAIQAGFR